MGAKSTTTSNHPSTPIEIILKKNDSLSHHHRHHRISPVHAAAVIFVGPRVFFVPPPIRHWYPVDQFLLAILRPLGTYSLAYKVHGLHPGISADQKPILLVPRDLKALLQSGKKLDNSRDVNTARLLKVIYVCWKYQMWEIWCIYLNPLTAKLFNLNFHPLEVVSRWRDPQLQVSENYSDLTKWRSSVFKYCWLMSHFIFNLFKRRYLMCQ